MKARRLPQLIALLGGAFSIFVPLSSQAGTNLLTRTSQGGGANWTAAIWQTNNGSGVGVGTAVAPESGNTYTVFPNATAFGNNQGNARLRNTVTSADALITFPGDSLTLSTNTEIRAKNITAPAALSPILNFPGVGGNAGLILDGGILNAGDDGLFVITGKVQVVSQSYICPGDNGGGATARPNRRLTIAGELLGTGNMVIFQAQTNNPQTISGTANTFSGQWIVKGGRLLGTVANSLGTNSITCDPGYVLPVPPFSSTAPVADIVGSVAMLEVNYDLNSAGRLTLVNGGMVRLHQICAFSAVTIEGTPLSPGTHFFPELLANFPNNFEPGGSGAIIVQPYGPLPSLGPTIITPPAPQYIYAGGTAHFTVSASVNGAPPLTYKWRKGGVIQSDAGNISGVTNATLTISAVSATDIDSYDVIVSNAGGSVTSAPAALTIVALSGELYEAGVASAQPAAYYRLNETGDPATNNSPVYDYAGGFNGTFGNAALNGNPNYNIAGPEATSGYPGFANNNKASQSLNLSPGSQISVSPWNLSTNTVTLTAWINPSGPQNPLNAIVFCRGGGTAVGLDYAAYVDGNGNSTLGYTWNDEFETRNWNTGLAAPPGQWSFVALVITPTSATIHVMNTNGLLSASQEHTHVVQSFSGTTQIGDDSGGANGARVFNGTIDDVAIFKRALSKTELVTLYTKASGVTAYAPIIAAQAASQSSYAGQTVRFTIAGGATDPLTYQWQSGPGGGPYTNIVNGGRFSGATTATLTIANVNAADAPDYRVILTNPSGSITSSVANLFVQPVSPPENITLSILQAAGADWDATAAWSDGLPASVSAAAKPGSTYELLAGARMRSPEGGPTISTFPGDVLTLEGNGGWVRDPAAGALISEIRFKQTTYGTVNGRVNFKRLVMNGGQLDSGNPNIIAIGGRIDVLTNCPINNDNGGDRGYLIDAWLTGTGNIEFHGYNQTSFQPTYLNPLNIAGTSNTFSGKWTVVEGVLLGSAPGSLGTNDIFVGANGALETLYDLNNTNANLILSGRMLLHQNDTFRTATVAGNSLSQGTYTFAQLAAAYPANFPSNWTQQTGSTVSNASGSLTVLVQAGPFITTQPQPQTLYGQQTAQFFVTAIGNAPLAYQWRAAPIGSGNYTNLNNAGNLSGATTTNLTITNLTAANGLDYVVVVTNALGAATSSVARLTVRPEPTITLQPLASQTLYEQQTAQFSVSTLGNTPLTSHWQAGVTGSGIYTNLLDGGKISGSTTTNLTIVNLGAENGLDYIFVVSNTGGAVTSIVATLAVLPVSPPENITMSVVQPAGNDWNTGADWSDGLPASTSAFSKPGSTYEVLAGARLRTPVSGAAVTFPGDVLTLDGDGVWAENGLNVSEIRFKQTTGGSVRFKRLVMNGGQLDSGDNSLAIIAGRMDVLTNAPIYADSAAGQSRAWQIDAWLTGSGSIELHDFNATFAGDLNITGTSNTFSGTWNIVQGALLGSGLGSLGTNDITIGANAALETSYNLNNPLGRLILDGKLFLHQNDTFREVTVGGVALSAGTYTFAQLNSAYPLNFPATWSQLLGSVASTGSGSITVLGNSSPRPTLQFQASPNQVTLTWTGSFWLVEANEVTGPWVTNAAAVSPFVAPTSEPRKFYGLQPR